MSDFTSLPPSNIVEVQLCVVDTILDRLVSDPTELEAYRSRFDRSPPDYSSQSPPGAITQADSPSLANGQVDSMPPFIENQALPRIIFDAHVQKLYGQILDKQPNLWWLTAMNNAECLVRQDWIDQGIWQSGWDKDGSPSRKETWLHEKARTVGLNDKQYDASRPYYQFSHQLSKERRRLIDEENLSLGKHDISTLAYENVKKQWYDWQIWDERWNLLPGLEWEHEADIGEEWLERSDGPKPGWCDKSRWVDGLPPEECRLIRVPTLSKSRQSSVERYQDRTEQEPRSPALTKAPGIEETRVIPGERQEISSCTVPQRSPHFFPKRTLKHRKGDRKAMKKHTSKELRKLLLYICKRLEKLQT